MLPRHAHLLGQMRQREGGCATLKPIVAVLPGDAVKDDRRELVSRRGERGFGNAAQNGAGCEFHDVSFRLRTTPDREACRISFQQRHLPVERVLHSR